MPAKSQAQRGYLATHFGAKWMRKHHFDNKGKLPKHAGKNHSKHEPHHTPSTLPSHPGYHSY